ncbi:MAG: hypothetical protein H5T86_11295, partial [Armatimonadetes bacterium]|nr:hypothetical protein [Armatimonadota bacterium]
MQLLLLDNAWVVCEAAPPVPSRILISGDRIEAVGTEDTTVVPEGAKTIDVFGRRVVAGFIDMHIFGANGASFIDATDEAIAEVLRFVARAGTTAVLATLPPAPEEELIRALQAIAQFRGIDDGARIVGVHLDGPFLNPQYAGHHDPAHFRLPAIDEIQRLWEASEGTIRQVTIAPELPGAIAAIEYMRELGISVALGYTGADFRTARRAVAY